MPLTQAHRMHRANTRHCTAMEGHTRGPHAHTRSITHTHAQDKAHMHHANYNSTITQTSAHTKPGANAQPLHQKQMAKTNTHSHTHSISLINATHSSTSNAPCKHKTLHCNGGSHPRTACAHKIDYAHTCTRQSTYAPCELQLYDHTNKRAHKTWCECTTLTPKANGKNKHTLTHALYIPDKCHSLKHIECTVQTQDTALQWRVTPEDRMRTQDRLRTHMHKTKHICTMRTTTLRSHKQARTQNLVRMHNPYTKSKWQKQTHTHTRTLYP
jgi:hypothetical protein